MKEVPYHIGIIIDGNRRWARERNLPTIEGHRHGFEKVKKVGDWCWEKGVKVITIYGFSTENWNRPKLEIAYLMRLFGYTLAKKTIGNYHKKGIRVQIIGQKERLSKSLQKKIKYAEELTRRNKKGFLNIAFSYGGRDEIVEAVRNIVKKKTPENKISEELINQNLWTKNLPYPDLIIRTGGHRRLSNFLTWQSAYSELYFLNKYWPEFDEKDLDDVFNYYLKCQRNFGK